MSEIRVPLVLSLARGIAVVALVGLGVVLVGRPIERPQAQVVVPEGLQPVSSAEFPVSDRATYTDQTSYHTGPTQGPTD